MTVKWGIMSTAKINKKILKAMENIPDCQVVAVASRSPEKVESFCDEVGLPASVARYGSYEELVEDKNVQVVYMPIPSSMHKEWVPKCARAGKHILVEKPVGLTASETEEMIRVCRDHNVQWMDGTMWMHHCRTERMLRDINSGALGEVKRVVCNMTTFGPDADPSDADNIRLKKDLDALGAVGDLGWYTTRAALWAFQEDPVSVCAFAHALSDEGVITSGCANLFFRNGRFATMDYGMDTNNRQDLEVAGTKASLRLNDFQSASSYDKSHYTIGTQQFEGTTLVPKGEVKDGGACNQEQCMLERMAHIVKTGKLEDIWPTWSLRTMRVIDAIIISSKQDSKNKVVPIGMACKGDVTCS